MFTSNRDDLIRYLHTEMQYGNGTRLWDAVDCGDYRALSKETNRRVVLVLSDGEDTTSKSAGRDEVLARAQQEDLMIYAVGIRSRYRGGPGGSFIESRPDRGLRKVAEETGGGYFELLRTAELNATFTKVADELHRQYVLGFSPETLDNKVHKLDVRIKVPGHGRAEPEDLCGLQSRPRPGAAGRSETMRRLVLCVAGVLGLAAAPQPPAAPQQPTPPPPQHSAGLPRRCRDRRRLRDRPRSQRRAGLAPAARGVQDLRRRHAAGPDGLRQHVAADHGDPPRRHQREHDADPRFRAGRRGGVRRADDAGRPGPRRQLQRPRGRQPGVHRQPRCAAEKRCGTACTSATRRGCGTPSTTP